MPGRLDEERRDRGDDHQADIDRADFAVERPALGAQEDLPRAEKKRRNYGCDMDLDWE
jgi:hypothetical protein